MFLARGRICEAPNFSQPTRRLFLNMHRRKLREDSKLEMVVIVYGDVGTKAQILSTLTDSWVEG